MQLGTCYLRGRNVALQRWKSPSFRAGKTLRKTARRSLTGPSSSKFQSRYAPASGLGYVPNVSAIIALDIAGLLVVLPEIERLALIGPLLVAVVARYNSPVAGSLGIAGNH